MSGVKHTPGPWFVGGTDAGTGEVEVVSEARPYVCVVLPGALDGRTVANARLIAAAPELLEALSSILGPDNGADLLATAAIRPNQWRAAVNAIAKATGGDA